MSEHKLFSGIRSGQRFTYADADTLLVWDDDLGLCSVDESKAPDEQYLVPVSCEQEPGA